SGAGADGLFGGGASPAGPDFKRNAGEPAALDAGCGPGRHRPYRRRSDRQAELADIVETGPDPAVDGVVRWRRVDLQRIIKLRFGVDYHERHISTLLKRLGFSHMSARPRHP